MAMYGAPMYLDVYDIRKTDIYLTWQEVVGYKVWMNAVINK